MMFMELLLPEFWLFYLLQAQFHYGWCRSRHSFGISCPHWWALVHVRRSVFILGHQAGPANLLLLLDGYLHHGFTVVFSLWVCLQRSFWIFWSREKDYILGRYCVGIGRNRCRLVSCSTVVERVAGKGDWEGERMVYVQLSDQWIWKLSHFTSCNPLDTTESCFLLKWTNRQSIYGLLIS